MNEHQRQLNELVIEYQRTRRNGVFNQITKRLEPMLRRRCWNDDERQIALMAIWSCLSIFDPSRIPFSLYAKIYVSRRLRRYRDRGSVVKLSSRETEIARKKERADWKQYQQFGGNMPSLREPTMRELMLNDEPIEARLDDVITARQVCARLSPKNIDTIKHFLEGNFLYGGLTRQALHLRRGKAFTACKSVLDDRYQLRREKA